MYPNMEKFLELLSETGYPFFRDVAPIDTPYPYLVYSLISESPVKASNGIFKRIRKYQLSLFTTGTEEDYEPIYNVFSKYKVPISSLSSILDSENEDTVLNLYTRVAVVVDG